MRPERFRYQMNLAFDEWSETKSVSKFRPLLREMNRVWKKWAKEGDDHRTGEETYGYENDDHVQYDMLYISDRWNCAFRLKWLLDGLTSGKISQTVAL